MSTQIGTLPASGTFQNERRSIQSSERKSIEYVINTSDETTFLGSYSIGTSVDGSLILASIETRATKGTTKITLNYVTEEELISGGFGGTGTTKSADANAIELPIESNGNYSRSWRDTKPGVTSYLEPAPVYTRTEVVSAFTFSESNIVDGVGERSNPTGMSSPTSNKWLKVGKRISPQGDKYVVEETWQYAIAGWDTDIYGP